METMPQYPSDRWASSIFVRTLAVIAAVALSVYLLILLYGWGEPRPGEAPARFVPVDHQPSPATFEVVRYFTAMTEDGQVAYQEITFTDGRYQYSCRVPGSGAGPVAPAPSCKLF